ncbi:MAG: TrkH family potassium uptake protein [Candidatus Gastranaerophilales bacterium]|nr:TrkH family potassium uptake protein [Candidatus Gastranaerophilales bacterium]
MRLNYLANGIGMTMIYTGLVLLVPVAVGLCYQEFNSILPFIISSFISFILGFLVRKCQNASNLENMNDIKKGEALFIVALSWIVFSGLGCIPYLFFGLTPVNAIFESVSGITTTGATILTHFDYPHSFFFWRSFTQWLGGLGIIVLFIAILPQFAVAGRQMFFAETPGPTEDKITPRIKNTASALWKVYLGLTLIEVAFLIWAGMPKFDAICNSLSTLSAGGFSPHPESIIGYGSNSITWIVLVFMFIAGVSFNLQYKALINKNPLILFKNEEFRVYFVMVLIMSTLIAISLFIHNGFAFVDNIRNALFQVISVTTSSGFASVDFERWNYTSKMLLFIVMFMGACASSAGGGIKIARWLVVFKSMKSEIVKILHTNAIVNIKIDDKTVPSETSRQIVVFVFFYFLIFGVTAVLLSIIEQNSAIGLGSAISSLGNIGPGVATLTGPLGNYEHLHESSKIIFIINMLVGRLELIPFMVMLNKDFWRFKD